MLGIIHAADFTAVALAATAHITRAYAGNYNNLLRLLTGRRTNEMSFGRTCRIRQTLQLQRGDNILAGTVAILAELVERQRFKACCQYNCTVFFRDQLIGLRIINCSCRTNLGADTAFTCLELDAGLTVDNRHLRNGLRKGNIDCAAILQSHIEFTRSFAGRTFFGTDAAAAAHINLHAACLFADGHIEIANKTAYAFYLAICIERNIFMVCCIHHLRCQDAGRAVECREGFVELRHTAADCRLLLHNINLVACFRNIQRRLNTGNTAADNQCALHYLAFAGLQRSVKAHLGNCCLG